MTDFQKAWAQIKKGEIESRGEASMYRERFESVDSREEAKKILLTEYGMSPDQCGLILADLFPTTKSQVEKDCISADIKTALEEEIEDAKYYRQLADKTSNEEVASILDGIADDEDKHHEQISWIRDNFENADGKPDSSTEKSHPMTNELKEVRQALNDASRLLMLSTTSREDKKELSEAYKVLSSREREIERQMMLGKTQKDIRNFGQSANAATIVEAQKDEKKKKDISHYAAGAGEVGQVVQRDVPTSEYEVSATHNDNINNVEEGYNGSSGYEYDIDPTYAMINDETTKNVKEQTDTYLYSTYKGVPIQYHYIRPVKDGGKSYDREKEREWWTIPSSSKQFTSEEEAEKAIDRLKKSIEVQLADLESQIFKTATFDQQNRTNLIIKHRELTKYLFKVEKLEKAAKLDAIEKSVQFMQNTSKHSFKDVFKGITQSQKDALAEQIADRFVGHSDWKAKAKNWLWEKAGGLSQSEINDILDEAENVIE